MTQEAVAALFGDKTSRQSIQNWESGKSFPKPSRWAALEQAFGLPKGWFMALKSGVMLPAVVTASAAQTGGVNHGTVAGVVHAAPAVQAVVGGGEIERDLCERIVRHLEGKSTDDKIEFRARVKALMDGAGPPPGDQVNLDLKGDYTPPDGNKVDFGKK